MEKKFEVIFLDQAIDFMNNLDPKTQNKIYYNIDKAKLINDAKLFKKLEDDIWELRTKFSGLQYRLFSFWDKTEKTETLVLATHGIIKKVGKVPKKEIEKAKKIRTEYFEQK